ncbi:MAG: SPOR domain-containing protein [Granulosicoccaceae bacterium]
MSDSEPRHTSLYLLALGLLVGFVAGFVMLLANLPVDTSLSDYHATRVNSAPYQSVAKKNDYEFYTVLADQVETGPIEIVQIAEEKTIIKPATRVVSASAQNLNTQNLADQTYAEIPASSIGQESYYLQAGSFANVADAEQRRAAVLLLGLEAFVIERQNADGVNGHRVRIGPFFDQNRLTEAKKRLRRGSVAYDIVRVTG